MKIGKKIKNFKKFLSSQKNTYLDKRYRLTILLYHRISPTVKFDPFNCVITPDKFENDIKYLKKNYEIITPQQLLSQCENNYFPKNNQILITFDDGFYDNYLYAFPILEKYSVSAIFSVLTDYIGKKNLTWDWEIINYINQNKLSNEIINYFKLKNKNKINNTLIIINHLKHIDPIKREKLIRKIFVNIKEENNIENNMLSNENILEMSNNKMVFGSHGASHTSLKKVNKNLFDNEVIKSKEKIEKMLNKSCDFFAFPFGSSNDFNLDQINILKNYGYKLIFSNIQGSNLLINKNLIKRIIIDQTNNLKSLFF